MSGAGVRAALRMGGALLLVVGLPAVLVTVWWFASAGSTSFYEPPLHRIVSTFGRVWTPERLRTDVLPSVLRLLGGYALAGAAGVGCGVLLGSYRTARAVAEPVLELFRAVPPPVLVPVIMLFAGIGDTMKVVVIAFGCFWPVLLNTVEGVRAVDQVADETARCYGVRGGRRLLRLVLPSAGPQIMAGLRQALSIGIILMVISEMFAASSGIGFTVVEFQRSFAIPEMWTGILVLGLLGVVLSLLFRLVEQRVLGWYHGLRGARREGGGGHA